MSVDIQDITAEVEDVIDRDASRAPRKTAMPDAHEMRHELRRMRARLRWLDERLEP